MHVRANIINEKQTVKTFDYSGGTLILAWEKMRNYDIRQKCTGNICYEMKMVEDL